MKNSEILRRAKGLIGTPDTWLHGRGAYKNLGRPLDGMCIGCSLLRGAETEKGRPIWGDPAGYVLFRMFERFSGIPDLVAFNEAQGTTHTEVMEAFDRAIALAEKEETPRISDTEYTKRFLEDVKVFDRRATKETI